MSASTVFKKTSLSAAISVALAASVPATAVLAQERESNDRSPGIEEIIVTATRRDSTIADVPYNVSVVSGDLIDKDHILSTGELLRGVPGASAVDYGARNAGVFNPIRIRGLFIDSNVNMDVRVSAVPPVSTYINDTPVYINQVLKDLERVEVLRGPQGTLYGSGSLGGTVRYITRSPVLGEFSGTVTAAYGETDGSSGNNLEGDLILNVPLGDQFAARAVVGRLDYDGVVDMRNVYVLDSDGTPVAPNGVLDPTAVYETIVDADTVEIDHARLSLLWEPNDNFEGLLSYSYQKDDVGGRMMPTEGIDGWGDPYGEYENGSIQREPSDREFDAVSLEMTFDLGFATLTSSSSVYDHSGNSNSENTGFYAQNEWLVDFYYNYPRPMASAVRSFGDEGFVQELRLTSNGEATFDWIVGAFYRDQDNMSSQFSYLRGFFNWSQADPPSAPFPLSCCTLNDSDFRYVRNENFKDSAVFGELTWNITDRFRLTGGLRYFEVDYENDTLMGVGLYTFFAVDDQVQFTNSDSDVIFKINASWNVNDDTMLYSTISEGYRRAGSNAVPLSGIFAEDPAWQTYNPDFVTNYEIGIKGAGDQSFWNVSLYYLDWEDIQANINTTNWGFFAAANGGQAHTEGLEAEYNKYFGNGWHTSIGYSYNDGELDDEFPAPDGGYIFGLGGARLPGLAEHTFNITIDNTFPLANGWNWYNSLSYYYQDETKNSLSLNDPRFNQVFDAFGILNFASTLSFDEHWSVGLILKNLTNERGISGVFSEPWMGTDPAQNYFGSGAKTIIARPRTVSVLVQYDFGAP